MSQPIDSAASLSRWLHVTGPLLGPVAMLAVATGAGWIIEETIGLPNVSMVYLPVIMTSAIRYGFVASLVTSVLSAMSYAYFLAPPLFTLKIDDGSNAIALLFFIVVAAMTSHLVARLRKHTLLVEEQESTMSTLFGFSRQLTGLRGLDELGTAVVQEVVSIIDADAVVVDLEDGKPRVIAWAPEGFVLSASAHAAALHVLEGRPQKLPTAGADTWQFVPLGPIAEPVATLGIRVRSGTTVTLGQRRILKTLRELSGIAAERIRLAAHVDQARMLAETDKLRAALLTSISHDLRTPLAGILGAITSLRSYDAQLDETMRQDLLATAQDETERMSRFVGNLLDMTRLDAGMLRPRYDSCDLQDIVGSALRRMSKILFGHAVNVNISDSLPMFRLDFLLFEQVLVNLLDNAAKYSPMGSLIEIRGYLEDGVAVLEVRDEGMGIPESDLTKVFDFFYRVRQGDHQRAGTGLGLAICRGFVESMGARIAATNRDDRKGCILRIHLPGHLQVHSGERA